MVQFVVSMADVGELGVVDNESIVDDGNVIEVGSVVLGEGVVDEIHATSSRESKMALRNLLVDDLTLANTLDLISRPCLTPGFEASYLSAR